MINNLQSYYYDQNNDLITDYGKNYLKKYDNNFLYALYDSIFNTKINHTQYKLIFEPNATIDQQPIDIASSKQKSQDLLYIQSILEKDNNDNDINKVILMILQQKWKY